MSRGAGSLPSGDWREESNMPPPVGPVATTPSAPEVEMKRHLVPPRERPPTSDPWPCPVCEPSLTLTAERLPLEPLGICRLHYLLPADSPNAIPLCVLGCRCQPTSASGSSRRRLKNLFLVADFDASTSLVRHHVSLRAWPLLLRGALCAEATPHRNGRWLGAAPVPPLPCP